MATWPRIAVSKNAAKKRGGAVTYRKVSILVQTDAPCGRNFRRNARVDPVDEISTENSLKSDVDIDVRLHMAVCTKDACIKKRGSK